MIIIMLSMVVMMVMILIIMKIVTIITAIVIIIIEARKIMLKIDLITIPETTITMKITSNEAQYTFNKK